MGVEFNPARHLELARIVIKESKDPDKLARAWQIVSGALEQRWSGSPELAPGDFEKVDELLHEILVDYRPPSPARRSVTSSDK
jgi:hypothetical protein